MKLEAELDKGELNKVLEKLDDVQNETKKRIADEISKTSFKVQSKAKRSAPVGVSGNLRASILVWQDEDDLFAQIYSNSMYAPYVEFGTKKKFDAPPELRDYASKFRGGKGGSFEDLLESIENWAEKKGIGEFAYPIAVNIAQDGVPAQPFLFPAWEKERPKLIKNIKKVLKSIAE